MWFSSKKALEAADGGDTSPVIDDLTRLYAPEAAPDGMTAGFEAALQQRAALSKRGGLFERLWSRPRLQIGIAGGIVAAAALTAAFAVLFLPGGARQPSVAEAQAFLQEIPDHLDVQPGQVLHTRTETYQRFGPKAVDIARGTGIATDHQTQETWIEVGADNNATRLFGRITDANGKVVIESKFENGVLTEIDPSTGQESSGRQPILQHGELKLDAANTRAQSYERSLATGATKVTAQSSGQITLLTREDFKDLAPTPDYPDGAYTVPYYADLDGVAIITIETLKADGTVPQGDIYILTKSGERVLVESATSKDEVLDSMPAGLFGEN